MRAGAAYTSATRPSQKDDDATQRPAIVKKGELESMDRLGSSDNCWASTVADVDYSQRLVFSDEEDFTDKRFDLLYSRPFSSLSKDDRLKAESEDYPNCCLLYCVSGITAVHDEKHYFVMLYSRRSH